MFPPIYHFNMQYSNRCLDWSGMDSLSLFRDNQRQPERKAQLEQNGWRADSIRYRYNSLGFRDREFDHQPCGLALGCSFTEGVGVEEDRTWCRRLSSLSGLRFWNLGVGGASMDTVYRMLHHVLQSVKPRCVVICAPPGTRFEYHTAQGRHHVVHGSHVDDRIEHQFFKSWFAQDENWQRHHEKNIAACKHLCTEQGVPVFVFCGLRDFVRYDFGRDLAHPGRESHARFAEHIWHSIQNKY